MNATIMSGQLITEAATIISLSDHKYYECKVNVRYNNERAINHRSAGHRTTGDRMSTVDKSLNDWK